MQKVFYVKIVLLFVVVSSISAGLGILCGQLISKSKLDSGSGESTATTVKPVDTIGNKSIVDTIQVVDTMSLSKVEPLRISVLSSPKYDPKTESYSVCLRANRAEVKFVLTAKSSSKKQRYYYNKEGDFKGVLPTDDGVYYAYVTDLETGEKESLKITGFNIADGSDTPSSADKKRLIKELARMINSGYISDSYLKSHFDAKYRVDSSNRDARDMTVNQIITRICSGEWSRIEITDMTLNSQGLITILKIKVFEAEN